jgi:hypothetical protein
MTYIIGLEKGQLHVRTPQNVVYHVGIHNEPSLEDIFKRHGLPEACMFSSSTDFPEEYGVPKDYHARAVISRVVQGMLSVKPPKPEHWKQDTPPEQAVAIIAGIEGWLSNLLDGTSQPERAAEGIQRGLEDLKILCGAKRGQPDGWLRKVW